MELLKKLESMLGYSPKLNSELKENKAILRGVYRTADFCLKSEGKNDLELNFGEQYGTVRFTRFLYRPDRAVSLVPMENDLLRGSIRIQHYGGKTDGNTMDMHIFESGKVASSDYPGYLKAVKSGGMATVLTSLTDLRPRLAWAAYAAIFQRRS